MKNLNRYGQCRYIRYEWLCKKYPEKWVTEAKMSHLSKHKQTKEREAKENEQEKK